MDSKLKILRSVIAALCVVLAGSIAQGKCSHQQGIIRVIDPALNGDSLYLSPIPPQLFNTYVNGMFTTPRDIQSVVPVGNTVEFTTASYPALYEYLNPNGVSAEIFILAMPGDTITVEYHPGEYYPTVAGPKTTLDAFRIQEPIHNAYQKLLRIERSTSASDAEKASARDEYQSTLRALVEANLDNAGSVAVLIKMDRSSWDELLPKIQPQAYASPLIAPTYYFMLRCVNWGVKVTPAEVTEYTR